MTSKHRSDGLCQVLFFATVFFIILNPIDCFQISMVVPSFTKSFVRFSRNLRYKPRNSLISGRDVIAFRLQALHSDDEAAPGYYSIVDLQEHEEIIKKSRFIARAFPATTWNEAKEFIETVSDPKASHNCWAFVPGSDPLSYRFSDDGEPGGTAGKPILNAIQAEQLCDVVVCVTRYFGGTKLGTGGLVRAYGSSARNCLILADRCFKEATIQVQIEVPMESIGSIYQLLSSYTKLGEEYSASSLILNVLVFEKDLTSLEQQIQDATRGTAQFRRSEEED
mmetsp:Transcript_19910/g.25706  ORF Transcript_19910/g.25706 Transcript_19910/m.25706 type:complete len:280 (-) Transcript_19910:162-1001(-)